MKRKIMLILVVSVLFVAFSLNSVNAENKVVSESIKVRVTIPIMQKMEVVKAVDINNFGYLFSNQEAGDSVIIEDAGAIRVYSNAKWRLEVNNIVPVSNYDILFRSQEDSRWQNLSNSSGFVTGEHGSHLLNFDIKIVSRNASAAKNLKQKVEFGYTLAGYLY